MDFELSEEQEQLKSEVQRFAENEILPVAKEYDREEKYPWEVEIGRASCRERV